MRGTPAGVHGTTAGVAGIERMGEERHPVCTGCVGTRGKDGGRGPDQRPVRPALKGCGAVP